MTTNYVDRLDSALIRPGRIDYQQLIGYCSEYQLRKLFRNFYPEVKSGLDEDFARLCLETSEELSPAKVQGFLMRHKSDPEKAIASLQSSKTL